MQCTCLFSQHIALLSSISPCLILPPLTPLLFSCAHYNLYYICNFILDSQLLNPPPPPQHHTHQTITLIFASFPLKNKIPAQYLYYIYNFILDSQLLKPLPPPPSPHPYPQPPPSHTAQTITLIFASFPLKNKIPAHTNTHVEIGFTTPASCSYLFPLIHNTP